MICFQKFVFPEANLSPFFIHKKIKAPFLNRIIKSKISFKKNTISVLKTLNIKISIINF